MFDTGELREHADASIQEGRRVLAQAHDRVKPNLDAARASAEPYLARVRQQTGPGYERAQAWFDATRQDPRVTRAVEGAETLTAFVVGTLSEYVVKPAMDLGQELGLRRPGCGHAERPAAGSDASGTDGESGPAADAKIE